MAINLLAVVLYGSNIWLRAHGPADPGTRIDPQVILSVLGVALLLVSGWLGGKMVHIRGVGVEGRE